jgi:activator of HSP90 ATPase
MWHWEERNANDWAKARLTEQFGAVQFDLSNGFAFLVVEVTRVTGEVR